MEKIKRAQTPLEIRHRRCLPHRRQGSLTGQVGIELIICLTLIFIFLLGITYIFVWFNQGIARRHILYEITRVPAGYYVGVDEIGVGIPLTPFTNFLLKLFDWHRDKKGVPLWEEW